MRRMLKKNIFLITLLITIASTIAEDENVTFSYSNRRHFDNTGYFNFSPIIFSFCLHECTHNQTCVLFTYFNSTNRCVLYSHRSWGWYSCDNCISGTKIIQSQSSTQSEETVSTVSTTAEFPMTTTEKIENPCTCVCRETNNSVDEILKERLSALSLNISKLSSTRRKLTCAEDQRPSAKNVGYFGLLSLSVVGGLLILFDLTQCFRHLMKCRN